MMASDKGAEAAEAPPPITEDEEEEEEARRVLKRHFGHASFRAGQWEVISELLKGRDVLFVAATGTGKSLVYQFGAVFRADRAASDAAGNARKDDKEEEDDGAPLPPAPGAVTLVLSPLLALQKDQVAAFAQRRVRACCLNGEQRDPQVWAAAARGDYHFLYSTPETALGRLLPALRELAAAGRLGCIAVDEAHVVSEWGADFRPDYRRLAELRSLLLPCVVPVLACTATATPVVRDDIVASLALRSPLRVVSTFNRPNLHYTVRAKSGKAHRDLSEALGPVFQDGGGGCAIVFVPTQRETEAVAEAINSLPFATTTTEMAKSEIISEADDDDVEAGDGRRLFAAPYHAGLPPERREAIHRDFTSGDLRVVVATIAFGMGIDKPDVRAVVNYGIPKNLESFYQQTGRAGRDGDPARCTMFWSAGDFATAQHLCQQPPPQQAAAAVAGAAKKYNPLDGLRALHKFVMTRLCRRKQLLAYFGEVIVGDGEGSGGSFRCEGCDVCDAQEAAATTSQDDDDVVEGRRGVDHFTEDARTFLEAIRFAGQRGGSLSTLRGILRGSRAAALLQRYGEAALQACRAYGRGAARSDALRDKFLQVLLTAGLVDVFHVASCDPSGQRNFSYAAYKLTPAGASFAADPTARLPPTMMPEDLLLQRPPPPATKKTATARPEQQQLAPGEAPLGEDEQLIFAALRQARMEAAAGRPAYIVAYDRVLRAIARARPSTLEGLRAVDGVSSDMARNYGSRFLAAVAKVVGGSHGKRQQQLGGVFVIGGGSPLPRKQQKRLHSSSSSSFMI
jgi:ATP-dependent DNA helicase RecQ